MNIPRIIFPLLIVLLCLPALSSELTLSLANKVYKSSFIAVITVSKVSLGEIKKRKNQYMRTQEITVTASVQETILGEKLEEVTFTCYAVDYTEGGTSHFATAGFISYQLKEGSQFIAYLKNRDDNYFLAGSSNQYLEKINADKTQVTDIGQTAETVPLAEKLSQLRQLAEAKRTRIDNRQSRIETTLKRFVAGMKEHDIHIWHEVGSPPNTVRSNGWREALPDQKSPLGQWPPRTAAFIKGTITELSAIEQNVEDLLTDYISTATVTTKPNVVYANPRTEDAAEFLLSHYIANKELYASEAQNKMRNKSVNSNSAEPGDVTENQ